MVNYNLIARIGTVDDDADAMIREALGADGRRRRNGQPAQGRHPESFTQGAIIKGKIVGSAGDDFVVELGLKSEGILDTSEFDEPDNVKIGDEVNVLLEDVEGDTGLVKISKRKADRIINWEAIMKSKKEGDPVSGKVTQEDQGRPARRHRRAGLPPRLAGGHPPAGRDRRLDRPRRSTRVILKIDEERRNIVISRRKMIEEQREELKKQDAREPRGSAQLVKGTVKNIADFGAFIDLGGIDGLLHITDMSLGPHQPPQRDAQDRPGDRSQGPARSTRTRRRSPSA